jgi:hypothetical protein
MIETPSAWSTPQLNPSSLTPVTISPAPMIAPSPTSTMPRLKKCPTVRGNPSRTARRRTEAPKVSPIAKTNIGAMKSITERPTSVGCRTQGGTTSTSLMKFATTMRTMARTSTRDCL